MILKVDGTGIYEKLLESTKPVVVLEGGSRSSKTWSLLQWILFVYCIDNAGKRITITRERLTWLKDTVLQDFKEITTAYNIPVNPEINSRRPEQSYQVFGNEISFIGLDEQQKLTGRKQDVAWINEAISNNPTTAVSKSDFDQIEMRTTERIFLDYNPKATHHWIYSAVLPRPDVELIHSTMLDNPFLEPKIRQKIESYEPTDTNIANGTADKNMWEIYGLGNRGQIEGLIFTNVRYVDSLPDEYDWKVYGLDFGFSNDPTALIELRMYKDQLWVKEKMYQVDLTNREIAKKFRNFGITDSDVIVADSADPQTIADLKRNYGFNMKPSTKGQGSVNAGIDMLKRYRLNLIGNNFKREAENYIWAQKNGVSVNKPVDQFNHLWDATRYAASYYLLKPKFVCV